MKSALFNNELVMAIHTLNNARCRTGNNTINLLLSKLDAPIDRN